MQYYRYPFLTRLGDAKEELENVFEKTENYLRKLFLERNNKASWIPEEIGRREQKRIVASFALAKLIVSLMGKQFWNWFAVVESKKARNYLDRENEETILEISSALGLRTVREGDIYLLNVFDYIKNAPREKEYLMESKELTKGNVKIKSDELRRLIESRIRTVIIEQIEELAKVVANEDSQMVNQARKVAVKLEKELKERAQTKKSEEYFGYPPCISTLLERLEHSENLSHNARWYLALFLLKRNVAKEKIVNFFSTSPDFDEKITHYHVSYLEKKNYSVPNCSNIKSMGLCVAECGIKNPLQYRNKETKNTQ